MFHGDEADRQAEMERLLRLHRDVKGVGADGVRYSALNPESWNWILISTFFVHRSACIAITGKQPSATANQAIWDRFRELTTVYNCPANRDSLRATTNFAPTTTRWLPRSSKRQAL